MCLCARACSYACVFVCMCYSPPVTDFVYLFIFQLPWRQTWPKVIDRFIESLFLYSFSELAQMIGFLIFLSLSLFSLSLMINDLFFDCVSIFKVFLNYNLQLMKKQQRPRKVVCLELAVCFLCCDLAARPRICLRPLLAMLLM